MILRPHDFGKTQSGKKLKLGKKILIGLLVFSLFNSFAIVFPDVVMSTSSALAAEAKGFSLKDAVQEKSEYLPTLKGDAEAENTPSVVIQKVTNYITGLAAGIAIFFIVINAGKLVFALGSSDDITKARKGLLWALGGLALIMFAFVIAKTIISLTFTGDL